MGIECPWVQGNQSFFAQYLLFRPFSFPPIGQITSLIALNFPSLKSRENGFVVFQNSTGRGLFIAVVTFNSVDVGGKSGGLEMYVIGDRPDKKTDWEGTWVITDGTGELADLKGEGDWWGPGYQDYPEECGVIYYSAGNLDV